MLSLILIIFASIFDACKDTLKDHFSISIFKNLNPNFWNPAISYHIKTIMTYRIDGWHICKSINIILICFAMGYYKPITDYVLLNIFIIGMTMNITFEIVYRNLSKKPN